MSAEEIVLVPLYLFPETNLPLRRWELLPGLWLERASPPLRARMTEDLKLPWRATPPFEPNFVIRLVPTIYVRELRARAPRVEDEAQKVREHLPLSLAVEPGSLARLVLMGLLLLTGINFRIAEHFTYRVGRRGRLQLTGGISREHSEEFSWYFLGQIPHISGARLNKASLKSILLLMEPYYRPYIWRSDRVGVALASLWAAVQQRRKALPNAYVTLTTALEALLSTTRQDTKHLLAERIAILLANTPAQRRKLYETAGDLYNIRSKIVHGDAKVKKGPQDWNSLLITPKTSTVPVGPLLTMASLCMRTIMQVLRSVEYMDIVLAGKDEDKTNKRLDAYFLGRLFS